jgi:hypothetical protein
MIWSSLPLRFSRLQDGSAAGGGALQHHVVQREEYLGLGEVVAAQVEIVGEKLEKLFDGEARIEDGGEGDLLRVQEIAQAFEQSGLPGAHFAGKYDKALTALDAIDQVCQGLFVLQASEQERWVRAHVERVLIEAEEGVVHTKPSPKYLQHNNMETCGE